MLKKLHGYLGRVAFCFYAAAEKPMVPSFPLIGFHYPKALTPNGSKSDLIFRSFYAVDTGGIGATAVTIVRRDLNMVRGKRTFVPQTADEAGPPLSRGGE